MNKLEKLVKINEYKSYGYDTIKSLTVDDSIEEIDFELELLEHKIKSDLIRQIKSYNKILECFNQINIEPQYFESIDSLRKELDSLIKEKETIRDIVKASYFYLTKYVKNELVNVSKIPKNKTIIETNRDASYSFEHVMQRIKERYPEIVMTKEKYDSLCHIIKLTIDGERTGIELLRTEKQANRVQKTFKISYENINLYVVFELSDNGGRDCITTFLPRKSFG